jgi:hypothetical protein
MHRTGSKKSAMRPHVLRNSSSRYLACPPDALSLSMPLSMPLPLGTVRRGASATMPRRRIGVGHDDERAQRAEQRVNVRTRHDAALHNQARRCVAPSARVLGLPSAQRVGEPRDAACVNAIRATKRIRHRDRAITVAEAGRALVWTDAETRSTAPRAGARSAIGPAARGPREPGKQLKWCASSRRRAPRRPVGSCVAATNTTGLRAKRTPHSVRPTLARHQRIAVVVRVARHSCRSCRVARHARGVRTHFVVVVAQQQQQQQHQRKRAVAPVRVAPVPSAKHSIIELRAHRRTRRTRRQTALATPTPAPHASHCRRRASLSTTRARCDATACRQRRPHAPHN